MKRKKIGALLLAASMLLMTGCGKNTGGGSGSNPDSDASPAPSEVLNTSDIFSDRDMEAGHSESGSVTIRLDGNAVSCNSNAVAVSGSTATITKEGTYILSGNLNDGMIIINTGKSEKVQLVFNGVSIHSATCAPLYIQQTDKVFITLAPSTENTLSNGGTFTAIDESNIDAVIYSKEDLTINGDGKLTVTSPGGHGIVSKDELTVTGGSFVIDTASHGITGKDGIGLTNANMTITAGKDGIQADNHDDAALGYIYIKSGIYTIKAEGDGISASAQLQIDNGTFDIVTGGGSVNGDKHTSDSWGDFPGGRPGGMGGRPRNANDANTVTAASADSTSIKGIKATGNLSINGGTFTMNCADDAVHTNASATISGGNFDIATGDDGFHADDTMAIAGGVISVTKSYEGLEGLHVQITAGDITLYTTDDGINAAGGTDSSGTGGIRGDQFGRPGGMGGGMGGSSGGSIVISGGKVYINASGDGIDANGSLEINGGYTVVCGPTIGDTATLDYDTTGSINGGTFIGTGAYNMAQSFNGGTQGVYAINVGSRTAETTITLTDGAGNVIIDQFQPELNYAVVIISTPEIVKGKMYKITVGNDSGEFAAS